MTFKELADYFEQLEATSSRLSLIEILSRLFLKIDTSEVAKVSYLIQGRVAPFYEATEIGMAEKNVASAIAKAYGIDREEVLKEYGQIGDLGQVVLKLSKKRRGHSGRHSREDGNPSYHISMDPRVKPEDDNCTDSGHAHLAMKQFRMTIDEVFDVLKEIAGISGDGTVEKKIGLLSGLLERMSGVEAKHLVRIPLGSSRLGIGDPTVLDAFATAKLGDRSQRKVLENAYNKVSDLGLIGEVLWQKGLQGVEQLEVTVGRPIRSQLCERINDPKTILDKFGGEAHVQYKYDGFRTQIHKTGNQVRIFSRNLEETTPMLPDVVEGVLKQIKAESIILDSESLAYNPESEEFLPFQETTKRRRKHGVEEAAKSLPLKSFVFDVMYLNGQPLVDLPLRERLERMKSAIRGDEILLVQPGEFVKDAKRINELFEDALTKGLEGLIVKRPDSKYEAGARNFNWIKIKRHSSGELKDTIDCVILGYIFGRGKRAEFGAGALLVGVYDKEKDEFVTVSKIGTGLSDEEWREIHRRADKIKLSRKPPRVTAILEPSVWVRPEIVIEVVADEITKSPVHTAGKTENSPGFALRFPRLVRFRESDKKAEDATTVKELIEMYNQQ